MSATPASPLGLGEANVSPISSAAPSRTPTPPLPLLAIHDGEGGDAKSLSETESGLSYEKPAVARFHKDQSIWSKMPTIFVDIVVVFSSLSLLAYITFIASTDGWEIDKYYIKHQDALSVIAPLFPMFFASIIGRLLYQITRWELEKGSSLGTLEQIMGSRTLGAAVVTHYHLKTYNLLAFVILIIWSLSPLGGQSLLRILDKESRPVSTTITYFDARKSALVEATQVPDSPFYLTALQSHKRMMAEPRDLWGNMKMPFLDQKAKPDGTGWVDANTTSGQNYISFIGMPVINAPLGNTTFTLESDYIQLDCAQLSYVEASDNGTLSLIGIEDIPQHSTTNDSAKNFEGSNDTWYGNSQIATDDEERTSSYTAAWTLGVDRFVKERYLGNSSICATCDFDETNLLFQTTSETWAHVRTQCRVLNRYVESRVTCSRPTTDSRAACRVGAQRPLARGHPSENVSLLNYPGDFSWLAAFLSRVTGPETISQERHLEYLFDIADAYATQFNPSAKSEQLAKNLAPEDFAARLSQVLNSFILTNLAQFTTAPDDGAEENQEENDHQVWTTVTAKTTDGNFVYSISAPWIVICLTSCIVLFVGGVFGVFFTHINGGPELLGYISTTLRDSRYHETCPSLDGLDGPEVSIRLKANRYRYGIYRPGLDGKGAGRMGIGLEEDIISLPEWSNLTKECSSGGVSQTTEPTVQRMPEGEVQNPSLYGIHFAGLSSF